MTQIHTLLTGLADTIDEIKKRPDPIGEEKIRNIVDERINLLPANEEFKRKFLPGQRAPEAPLIGTKFARHRLTVSDIEMAVDILTSAKRSGMSSGPSDELMKTFQAVSTAMYLPEEEVRRIDRQAIDNLFPRVLKGNANRAELQAYQRAMDSAESGYGSQLVGAQYVSDLWEEARPESRVFPQLRSFEMTAPTAYLPVPAQIPEMLFVSESTANNSANYDTVKTGSNRVQVDAKKQLIHQMWSGEMEEDAIIAYLPFLRAEVALSLGHYSDSLVLNGDTTNAGTGNINLDDADPADTKHYLAFDGIRHAGLVDNTNNRADIAGAVQFSDLIASRKRMIDRAYHMDWGHPNNPMDLLYIGTPEDGDAIAKLDEFLTVDKFGSNATVLTGQIGRVGQNPFLTSMALSLTEADGKVSTTGSNNTKGQIVVFNRRGVVVGWRRRIKVETERLPASDQSRIVYSMRLGLGRFTPTGAASGMEWADVLYDITV